MRVSPLRPELPAAGGQRRYWKSLHGSSRALAVASAARRHDSLSVVIAADQPGAHRFVEELSFFGPTGAEHDLLFFPDWETLPYDRFSPYQDIISTRLATLVELRSRRHGILVVAMSTLMHRLLPVTYLDAHSLLLRCGQTLVRDSFMPRLDEYGYRVVSQVMEHGDVAIRGSILDIYPMGCELPFRLDLLDNEIDSIRSFDIETQRSLDKQDEVRVLPSGEAPLTASAIATFRSGWRARFAGNPAKCPIYRDVSNGIAPAGVEYFLPLFYEHTSALVDYLPQDALLVMDAGAAAAGQEFQAMAQARYAQGKDDHDYPLLPPEALFQSPAELDTRLQDFRQVYISATEADTPAAVTVNFATSSPRSLPVRVHAPDPLIMLRQFMDEFDGRLLLVAESAGRRETILELFRDVALRPVLCRDWDEFIQGDMRFGLTVAPLERGASLEQLVILSEAQLFGERVQQRRLRQRPQRSADAIIGSLTELSLGAPVVHEEHGIGRYRGLLTLTVDALEAEFICLEYDRGDKLYVPVAALDLVSRFVGVEPEHAPLHRLGSGQWQKAKRRAMRRVHDVAAELLELYARRAAVEGHEFVIDNNAYQAFAQGFPFEETPGQADAIAGTLADMRAPRPMDRLICGDSGFGKTEVAMRAAFVAVENHKQVAMLTPTTLLAHQHCRNFKDRFADWPVRVEALSRFVPGKSQTTIAQQLSEGKIDIVIGTHKLLQEDIRFNNLGLLIIDEEHRFGVKQKERLKSLRAQVDILTLTATPIPRTLNLALSDLRGLSVITTPPSRRLPVRLFVKEWDDVWIKEALLREIKRGGQVYFLHNEIDGIEKIAAQIAGLAPEAEVRVAHGRMSEKVLEQVMLDFYHLRFNVLVCTTIIETGIDVPSANTIIINRADRFGLAQLYQLRGRVGRSHHRAYAYLITPEPNGLSDAANKRLQAIAELDELGMGFTLATQDMEIRGVGELLGDEQSGQIQEIGFGMYMNLLERAVASLKAGRQPELDRPLDHGAEIDIRAPALIPADYLPDVHTRLIMYKRIAAAPDQAVLQGLREECIDRFGMLPPPLRNLFRITVLKLEASPLGIRRMDLGEDGGRIYFHESTPVAPQTIVDLLVANPELYRPEQPDGLRIKRGGADLEARFGLLEQFLEQLSATHAGTADAPVRSVVGGS